jgi:hypothetical protein
MGCCQSSNPAIVNGHRIDTTTKRDNLPKPKVDKNLTDEDRERIRKERAAAAEARLKKNHPANTKSKDRYKTDDLRGPNTKYAMTWQAG